MTGSPDPTGSSESGRPLLELAEVMALLRAECSWKAGQTHRSLARYLLEETHETLEAIDTGEESGDWAHLREELGDLLLQVYFHAVIATERGEFTIDDVAGDLIAKLRRRNPHVFGADGSSRATDPATINEVWEAIKASEKQRTSVLDGLPPTLPALLLADKALDRLARTTGQEPRAERPGLAGRAASPDDAAAADPATDVGERLLALVAEARGAGVDPEQALRDAVRRLVADR
ncbi:nucleotide pyrophosphohydrolase [Nocardioides guangzhouensis]|uniref:Nucleotide pyrophosphohydrolase n=1 Tax=Nocardioides guangzhouensis TaxID=2497878 RepID=A0A4Q4Z6I4_9ACTN|nr:MazG family protein [Nocardioides guangzhouensis]RYP83427.1 nucleotide pyrophosphohydrolase [Nocardioides guangzhouensis]